MWFKKELARKKERGVTAMDKVMDMLFSVFSFLFRPQQCQETVMYIFMAECSAAATAATWYLICWYS
jgi:amino acid permease